MNIMKVSTGTVVLDTRLDSGYQADTLTATYGPASSGKTNYCLHAALQTVKDGKKVIYIDTEGVKDYSTCGNFHYIH